MTLKSGQSLGPHQILEPIGAGGQGEVYKARDTRLNRTVAIKVLPEESSNPELKQRFEREAQSIAALNHPHICTLYDVGHQDGIDFLVMEYLEGESLAERLARGQIVLAEALTYALQIADALDKAHRQGIVHRDLKPGNIMITKSGAKLLDFGLARLRQPAPTPAFTVSTVPTEKSGLTIQGAILGTLQYMSPEQLEGKEADARTDIFAFGAVLYEMITGKKAFEGKSQVSLIGAILERDPAPVSTIEPASPAMLDSVIKKCLAKEPDDRWQSAGDVATALQWVAQAPGAMPAVGVEAPAKPARRSRLVASLLVASIALAAALIYQYRSAAQPELVRFFVAAPDKTVFFSAVTNGIGHTGGRISPNGRKIAFTARDETGKVMLWVRSLDTLTAQVLPGTEGSGLPFWSPDSRTIGFFTRDKLKKIDVDGGPPVTLCDVAQGKGGTWNQDGVILFGGGTNAPIFRVSSAGGQPVQITKPVPPHTGHRYPSFLPDGKHYFYFTTGVIETFLGSLDSTEAQKFVPADSQVVYAPPGYVLFVRQGTLMAQPFDAQKLKLTGEAVPVAEQVATGGAGAFSVSDTGTLLYRTGPGNADATFRLTWLDRTGKTIETAGAPGGYLGPDLSPDGKLIAVHRHEGNGGDAWIVESTGGKTTRLTFDATQDNSNPIWSPDGRQIAYESLRNKKWGIYVKASNGTGTEDLLVDSETMIVPMSWSQDGKTILYNKFTGEIPGIWAISLMDRKTFAVVNTPFFEIYPQISPDGKYFAYTSNNSGKAEIYVQTFPPGGGKWQISTNGGALPRWRHDGKELFFMEPGRRQDVVFRNRHHGIEIRIRCAPGPFQYDFCKR
jgi:Tol biopolymer transport system component/predicted Ser/Thr protein kinase